MIQNCLNRLVQIYKMATMADMIKFFITYRSLLKHIVREEMTFGLFVLFLLHCMLTHRCIEPKLVSRHACADPGGPHPPPENH